MKNGLSFVDEKSIRLPNFVHFVAQQGDKFYIFIIKIQSGIMIFLSQSNLQPERLKWKEYVVAYFNTLITQICENRSYIHLQIDWS